MTITPEQRTWARVAGVTLLLNYVLQGFGDYPTIIARGSETFEQTARYAASNEMFWRFALFLVGLDWVVIGVASFALFAVFAPVHPRLAQLALVVRLGTCFIGAASLMFRFAMTRIYGAVGDDGPFTLEQLRVLSSVLQRGANGGIWIAWVCQSVGTLLFYVLLLRSRYLPRALAWAGIVTQVVFFGAIVAMFVLPRSSNALKMFGLPGLAVEVTMAVWFLTRGLPRDREEGRR